MESLQYNACVSSHSFGSSTKNDHDYGEIGIVETPYLSSFEVATKRLKGSSWNFSISDALRSPTVKDDDVPKANQSRGCNKRTTRSMDSRSKLNLQYHVIAERRRRDILSQRLIALSALIPCLKKMNKASVLEEAVKYVEHLQERVKNLEEKAKQQNVESKVLVKTTHLVMDENYGDTNPLSSTNEEVEDLHSKNDAFPEMKARFSNKDVLLTLLCENKLELLGCILSEMEMLHLTINTSNFLSFENYMVISISAQMNEHFSVTAKELVTKLRRVFLAVIKPQDHNHD